MLYDLKKKKTNVEMDSESYIHLYMSDFKSF